MQQLCDDCIFLLAQNLSPEGKKVINAIAKHGKMRVTDIKRKAGLTRAKNRDGIEELAAKRFIASRSGPGRSTIYGLTKNGVKFIELLQTKGEAK